MKKRDYTDFVNDIKDAIKNIDDFVKDIDFEKFNSELIIQKAVIRCLEEIGEAAKNVPDDIRNHYPDVPWKEAAGLRDKLIHFYWGVDLKIVWDVIKYDIITLKKSIEDSAL